MNKFLFICTLFSISISSLAQITLDEAIRVGLNNSASYDIINFTKRINELEKKLAIKKLLPTLSMSLSAPSYSHSISPVNQSDGTIKYFDTQKNTMSSNMSLNVPLIPTGGNITVYSSFGVYMNLNNDRYTDFSANFYQISISQPLSFYSNNLWQKKINEQRNVVNNIMLYRDIVDTKEEIMEYYFDVLSAQLEFSYACEKYQMMEYYFNNSHKLYDQNKISYPDFLEISLLFEQAKLEQNQKSTEYKLFLNAFEQRLEIDINENEKFILPRFPNSLSFSKAIEMLKIKQEIFSKYDNLIDEQEMKYYKSRKGIDGTISLSYGANSSSSEFSNLRDKKIKNESISLSLSVPLINWRIAKHEYELACLKHQRKVKENQVDEEKETQNLLMMLEAIKTIEEQFEQMNAREELLAEKLRVCRLLFDNGELNIKDLKDCQNDQTELLLSKTSKTKNFWSMCFQIEKLTYYNFIKGYSYIDL